MKYGYKVRGVAADGKTLGPMSSTGVTAKVTAASTTPDYVKLTSARRVTGGIQLTWGERGRRQDLQRLPQGGRRVRLDAAGILRQRHHL